jgi:hypothetical protein
MTRESIIKNWIILLFNLDINIIYQLKWIKKPFFNSLWIKKSF